MFVQYYLYNRLQFSDRSNDCGKPAICHCRIFVTVQYLHSYAIFTFILQCTMKKPVMAIGKERIICNYFYRKSGCLLKKTAVL